MIFKVWQIEQRLLFIIDNLLIKTLKSFHFNKAIINHLNHLNQCNPGSDNENELCFPHPMDTPLSYFREYYIIGLIMVGSLFSKEKPVIIIMQQLLLKD